ncbi:hypothetical protein OIDMADRAFT_185037 [Oidiodendron maius Zn]|uniref:Uncharacterized protein n=1 Tax=Oidiodendron maius (strain Zn) TaxID=913774 RepID=A0A0C3GMJ4_OIDMZ|nr:hypothetical protein OIDMADRAFT_185037 [Oidiodendron maius Zn]
MSQPPYPSSDDWHYQSSSYVHNHPERSWQKEQYYDSNNNFPHPGPGRFMGDVEGQFYADNHRRSPLCSSVQRDSFDSSIYPINNQPYPPSYEASQAAGNRQDAIVHHPQPRAAPLPHEMKACVIPQLSKKFGSSILSPFARAYAPDLVRLAGLKREDILTFIDDLNEAFVANSVLQAASGIAGLVGFIPLHTAQLVSNGVGLAANVGAAGVSHVRTKQYLKYANETLFGPRGLRVQIFKTEKMLEYIRFPKKDIMQGDLSRIVGTSGVDSESGVDLFDNRMKELGDYIMPLIFDARISAPLDQDNRGWMKQLGDSQVRRTEKKQLKELKKEQDKTNKMTVEKQLAINKVERESNQEIDSILRKLDDHKIMLGREWDRGHNSTRHSKAQANLETEINDLEKKLQKAEQRKREKMADKENDLKKEVQKISKKEVKTKRKLFWLVITPNVDWSSEDDIDEM